MATIFDASPVGMLMCDAKGMLTMVNPALEAMFGWERGELIGKSVEQLVPHAARPGHGAQVASFVASEAARMIGTGREVKGVRRDGTILPMEVSLTPVQIDGERRILGSVVDISERKELERKYQSAQRLEALGQLAGGVAHDFNNLLTAIINFTSFVHSELSEDDPKRSDLDEVLRAAGRASELTRQLLAFSRQQPLKATVLDLSGLVIDVEKLLRRVIGEDVQLRTVLTGEPCTVLIDAGQFEQVLLNLAVNARDAMPNGGSLTIETSSRDEQIVLSVHDSGNGIAEEHLEHIFQPFFTTKQVGKGTGLGLATCYGIVEHAGGELSVTSSPSGTTFQIALPRVEGTPSAARKMSEYPAAEARDATILLVEDDNSVRRAVTRLLSSAGYHVLGAESPAEAQRFWETQQEDIDVLLTDLVLPEMDGVSLAQTFRADRDNLVVMFITGYAPDRTVVPPDFDAALLRKPFDSKQLLKTLDKALAGVD
jgi:two-component system cell cycle sensor histidine kinase/response regulator CckA